jgi:hypothetical protein
MRAWGDFVFLKMRYRPHKVCSETFPDILDLVDHTVSMRARGDFCFFLKYDADPTKYVRKRAATSWIGLIMPLRIG